VENVRAFSALALRYRPLSCHSPSQTTEPRGVSPMPTPYHLLLPLMPANLLVRPVHWKSPALAFGPMPSPFHTRNALSQSPCR
jgi:hypothetical protein